jgi:hypothetical protein
MSNQKKIFISHASKDKKLADAFVDFLVLGLNIKNNDFFCSSLEGLGIPTGENFIDFIQKKLEGCKIVIPLLSPNYYESRFCPCELGASWILSRTLFPIIVPPLQFSDIDDVLSKKQMRIIDRGNHLDELRDELTRELRLKNIKSARWGSKKDQFLNRLPKVLAKLPAPTIVPLDQYQELKEKYDDLLQQMESLEEENEEKREIIDELKNCKDKAEVRSVVKKYSTLEDNFDDLIKNAKKILDPFPYIVIEALYYHFRGEPMPIPSPFEESRYDDIKRQMEYEYLCGSMGDDHEAGYVEVCEDNPKIEKAIDSLSELQNFISEVTDEDAEEYEDKYMDFVDDFREENGFNSTLSHYRRGGFGVI